MYKSQLANRLKIILDTVFNGNISKFGKSIGVTEGSVRGYIVGKKSKDMVERIVTPSAEVIASIVTNIGINSEWLLLGEGEMLKCNENNILPPANYTRPFTIDYSEFASMCKTIQSQQETINNLTRKNGIAGSV